MASRTYSLLAPKDEKLTEFRGKTFLIKLIYFKVKSILSKNQTEKERFFCEVVNYLKQAKKFNASDITLYFDESETCENKVLFLELEFPDYGKLLQFESALEERKKKVDE